MSDIGGPSSTASDAEPDLPYLPPPEPQDNPAEAQKPGGTRNVVRWLVLIGLFVALYQFLLSSRPHPRPMEGDAVAAPTKKTGDGLAGSALALLWPIGLIGGFIALVRWQIRGSSRFALAQEPGILALAVGDTKTAARVFAEVEARYRDQVNFAGLARLNHATALLRAGDLRGAAALLVKLERTAGLLYRSDLRLHAAVGLCEVYALRGDVVASRRWLEDARRRLSRVTERTYPGAMLRRAEVLLLCREGHAAESAALLDRDLRLIESGVNVQTMRLLWLVRAYLTTQLGGAREQGAAARWIDLLRPARPGELAALADWPALRLYAEAAGLSA